MSIDGCAKAEFPTCLIKVAVKIDQEARIDIASGDVADELPQFLGIQIARIRLSRLIRSLAARADRIRLLGPIRSGIGFSHRRRPRASTYK
jgi:hypothetical protein